MKQDTSNMKVGEKVGKRKVRALFIYGRENQTSEGHCQTKSEFSNHRITPSPALKERIKPKKVSS